MTDRQGPLIIIGGHEDKQGDKLILRAVAECSGEGKLVIATVASHEPEGYFDSYRAALADLGVTNLTELYVNERVEKQKEDTEDPLRGAESESDRARGRARGRQYEEHMRVIGV